jgi:CheY-like chemotaxis protein
MADPTHTDVPPTQLDFRVLFEAAPGLYLVLTPNLPKLNGYEVARRIRQQPWGRDVVLVALTGWGQVEDRRRSQEAGFNFHIVKPVELAALEELLAAPIKS